MVSCVLLCGFLLLSTTTMAVEIPDRINDLPIIDPYQPEKAPNVPILLGERRCDTIYHGAILPCLLRPQIPPYSYSTESLYNTEYKK